jgi:hypothetical protein
VASRTDTGKPAKAPPGFRLRFAGPDGDFERYDGQTDATWMPKDALPDTPDLRALGVRPVFCWDRDIHDALWKDLGQAPPPRKYAARMDGSLHVVSVDVWDRTMTWWIDPDRGWQATRVTYSKEGVVEREARVSLAKFGEYWFPQSVMYFNQGYRNGTEPWDVVTVDKALFNDARQPQVLSPADIGITPRMFIWLKDNTMMKVGTGAWDGTQITDVNFFAGMGPRAELVTHLLEKGGLLALASQPVAAATSQATVPESEWEAYTRRFIERYKLTSDQAHAAMKVLHDCQEQAQTYLARHESEFKHLDDQEQAARQADAADRKTRLESLAEARRKLRAPLDEIFEQQLKPRLEKLPTRKQRADAEGTLPAR